MIISLDRLTEPQQRSAIDRAERLAPAVSVTERGNGHVRADVECNGTCGARAFHDGKHDVVLRWDGIMTCSCPTVHSLCYHAAALLSHEGGEFPPKPKDCTDFGCGGQLMYWDGGNGHAAQCPRSVDPDDRYEAPQAETARRIAAGAVSRQPVPLASGRQRVIDKTRPTIHVSDDSIVIYRGCGHTAYVNQQPWEYIAAAALPLSPFEGCPECGDSMTPPAPDQVAARVEGV